MSLRQQLKDMSIQVVEVLLHRVVGSGMISPERAGKGVSQDVFVDSVITNLVAGDKQEITYESEHIVRGDRATWDALTASWDKEQTVANSTDELGQM